MIIFGDEYTTDEHCRTKLTDGFRTDGIWISTSNRFSYPFSPLDGAEIVENILVLLLPPVHGEVPICNLANITLI